MLNDHPLRYALSNELHARPFPVLTAPSHAVYLATKPMRDAAARDKELDRAHLIALLDRFGATHPTPGATHYSGELGRHRIKWENHTEFTTYTVFLDGVEARPFDPVSFDVFPADWLAEAPGVRVTSALLRIEPYSGDPSEIEARLDEWFVPESLAVSNVVDDQVVIAGDFRIDSSGHSRFAIFADPHAGPERTGRVVQRVTEIETYKSMSMLGLNRARTLNRQMGELDQDLTQLVGDMTHNEGPSAEDSLERLLTIAAELENLRARSAFRFGATGAYEAIVMDRISMLRETRFEQRQSFRDFMTRRFDPAMRTVKSTERQLGTLAQRAARAGELLRTRVDVERQAQNQRLLESMDRRADLALRLQETVEGLSVVAISYYAVSLAAYTAYPAFEPLGLSKGIATAILTPLVVGVVWLMVRRIRNRLD